MVLVTGASGLIGSFIVRQLLYNGYQVMALRRETSDLSLLQDIEDQVDWHVADILDIINLRNVVEKADYVIHAAGMVSYDQKDKDKLYQVNVEGTRNLVNACLENNIQKFILISSIATYANQTVSGQLRDVNETTPQKMESLGTNYAKAKYLAEMEAWRGKIEGLFTMVVNPSVVLGPGNWHESSTRLFKYAYDEKKFYIHGAMNYVDVRDLAAIVGKLLSSGRDGDQYIVSAGSICYRDLFTKMAECFNKKPPSVSVGKFMLQIGYWLDQLRSLITLRRPVITKEVKSAGTNRIFYRNDKIKQDLYPDFRSIDDTIKWSCEQLKAKAKEIA